MSATYFIISVLLTNPLSPLSKDLKPSFNYFSSMSDLPVISDRKGFIYSLPNYPDSLSLPPHDAQISSTIAPIIFFYSLVTVESNLNSSRTSSFGYSDFELI